MRPTRAVPQTNAAASGYTAAKPNKTKSTAAINTVFINLIAGNNIGTVFSIPTLYHLSYIPSLSGRLALESSDLRLFSEVSVPLTAANLIAQPGVPSGSGYVQQKADTAQNFWESLGDSTYKALCASLEMVAGVGFEPTTSWL
jgi:hypothetical protein